MGLPDQTGLGTLNVSRETSEKLRLFEGLLVKWNRRINLIGPNTIASVWERHFLDSAQLFGHCANGTERWIDLGSGAGLPGLVVAVLAQERSVSLEMTLVESDTRKTVFMAEVARHLGLKVRIFNTRIEDMDPVPADVISARALAPLSNLLGYSHRLLVKDGICLFLKGKNYVKELELAQNNWHFDVDVIPSAASGSGVILRIGNLSRAD